MIDPAALNRQQQERERRETKLKMYRALWNQSEAILNLLRREGATPPRALMDQELIEWAEKL